MCFLGYGSCMYPSSLRYVLFFPCFVKIKKVNQLDIPFWVCLYMFLHLQVIGYLSFPPSYFLFLMEKLEDIHTLWSWWNECTISVHLLLWPFIRSCAGPKSHWSNHNVSFFKKKLFLCLGCVILLVLLVRLWHISDKTCCLSLHRWMVLLVQNIQRQGQHW